MVEHDWNLQFVELFLGTMRPQARYLFGGSLETKMDKLKDVFATSVNRLIDTLDEMVLKELGQRYSPLDKALAKLPKILSAQFSRSMEKIMVWASSQLVWMASDLVKSFQKQMTGFYKNANVGFDSKSSIIRSHRS